jgi:ELWxxDGT repeat protein
VAAMNEEAQAVAVAIESEDGKSQACPAISLRWTFDAALRENPSPTKKTERDFMRLLEWIIGGCAALVFGAGAQAAHLVADINAVPTASGAQLSGWVQIGSSALFLLDDGIHGQELWRTDGTSTGTALVKDIAPGPASSAITSLTLANGVLYFLANDGTNGQELWRSDGTASGTHIVADINKGAGDGAGVQTFGEVPLPTLNGILYFTGTDATGTSGLWRSDGTAAGTYKLSDNAAGVDGTITPFSIVATSSRIFFAASDASAGQELWTSDGTTAGTHRVADIHPGNHGSDPQSLTATSAGVFFTADDGSHGRELWFADGDGGGAHLVSDLGAGSSGAIFSAMTAFGSDVILNATINAGPNRGNNVIRAGASSAEVLAADLQSDGFVSYGGRLLFSAASSNSIFPLWVTDGTAAGTKQLGAGIGLVTTSLIGAPGDIGSLTGSDGVYFFGYTGAPGIGVNLWRTDGTDAGTMQYAALPMNFVASDMAQFQGKIFLAAGRFGASGEELWESDGTPSGTMQFADLNPGAADSSPNTFAVIGSRLYFQATTQAGPNPWVSDGTVAGTLALSALQGAVKTGDGVINSLIAIGNRVVFAASDGIHGTEPWVSDGTVAGTFMLRDINADPNAVGPATMFALNSLALFPIDDGVHGMEMWVTDGTSGGTHLLKDINPGSASSNPIALLAGYAVLNGIAYFSADDGVHGSELWRSDGTEAGTYMVVDLIPGSQGGYPSDMHVLNGKLVFLYQQPEGPQWWATDGTAAGTIQLTNGVYVISPSPAAVANGVLYFGAQAGLPGNVTHVQLWGTDGTVAGTRLAADPTSSDTYALIGAMFATADHVLFQYCFAGNCSLYSSDGTRAGTAALSPDIPSYSGALLGNQLFYPVNTTTQNLLRVTDGTKAGTRDILTTPTASGGEIYAFSVIQNQVLFSQRDPILGPSIWRTDGTAAGTTLVVDVDPGATAQRVPSSLTEAGSNVFFIAYAPQTGSELYVMDGKSPNAASDAAVTAAATPVMIPVLSNDGSVSGSIDPASVVITLAPLHGTASVDTATGGVTYTPANDFSGGDQFTYTVASLQGQVSSPADVFIIVGDPAGPAPGTAPSASSPGTGSSTSSGGGGGGGRLDAVALAALAALCLIVAMRRRRARG